MRVFVGRRTLASFPGRCDRVPTAFTLPGAASFRADAGASYIARGMRLASAWRLRHHHDLIAALPARIPGLTHALAVAWEGMQFGSGAQGPGCRPEFRLTLGSHSASVSVVTIGEPRLGQDEKPASTPREGRLHERIVDWFWRGSEMARVRQALPEVGDRGSALAARARTSAELAKNMLASDEPGEISSEDSACEAYRQSTYWALCSLLAREEPTFQPEQGERIWATLDPALLAQAVSDEARIEGLQTALRSGSFVYFAELPKVEQQALLIELRKLSQALLTKLDE